MDSEDSDTESKDTIRRNEAAVATRKRVRRAEDTPKRERKGGLLAAMKKYAAARVQDPEIKKLLPSIPAPQLPRCPTPAAVPEPAADEVSSVGGRGKGSSKDGHRGRQQNPAARRGRLPAVKLETEEAEEEEEEALLPPPAQLLLPPQQIGSYVLPVVMSMLAPPNLYMQQQQQQQHYMLQQQQQQIQQQHHHIIHIHGLAAQRDSTHLKKQVGRRPASSTRIRLSVPWKSHAPVQSAPVLDAQPAASTPATKSEWTATPAQRQQHHRRQSLGLLSPHDGPPASRLGRPAAPGPGMVMLSQLHSPIGGDSRSMPAMDVQQAPSPDERLAQQAVDLLDKLASPQVLMVGPPRQPTADSSSPLLTPLAWMLREQGGQPGAPVAGTAPPALPSFQSPITAILRSLLPAGGAPGSEQLPEGIHPVELAELLEREDWSIEGLLGSLPSPPAPPAAVGPIIGLPRGPVCSRPLPNSGASTPMSLSGTAATAVAEAEAAAAAATSSAMLATPLMSVLLQGGAAAGRNTTVSNSMPPPAQGRKSGFASRQHQQQAQIKQQQQRRWWRRQQAVPKAAALLPAPAFGVPVLVLQAGGPAGGGSDAGVAVSHAPKATGAAGRLAATPGTLASPSLDEWLRCC